MYRPSKLKLFCWPSRQLLAIFYNRQLQNILYSPVFFQHCWVQYWYRVLNIAIIPNITYILHYNVSLSTFATVDRPSSRSVNIFVNISQICVESALFSVKPSLDKCICVEYLVVFSLMEINNFSPQVPHLWLVWNERTPILLFWARVVIGRKRLGGSGWVRYTVTPQPREKNSVNDYGSRFQHKAS